MKGKCDICNRVDGFQDNNLQECRRCGLKVHETCNGMLSTTTKLKDWECLACRSIPPGQSLDMRPSECALCNVTWETDKVHHAMHPLYDKHGKGGKHIMLSSNGKTEKKAWIHSLCGFFLSSNHFTRGTLYGCDESGFYDGEDKEGQSDEESDASVNEEGQRDVEIHHFVIAQKDPDGQHTPWTKRIMECRSNIRCQICKKSDKEQDVYRIAIQCCYGDSNELEEFKKNHPKLLPKEVEECYTGMHIGCARWGIKENTHKINPERIFFFPGANDSTRKYNDPVCNAFCHRHGLIVNKKKSSLKPSASVCTEATTDLTSFKISKDMKRREELEKQDQKELHEQRREIQKEKLSKKILQDLKSLVIELFRADEEMANIKTSIAQRKSFWHKESRLDLQKFKRIWNSVQDAVNTAIKDERDAWKLRRTTEQKDEMGTGKSKDIEDIKLPPQSEDISKSKDIEEIKLPPQSDALNVQNPRASDESIASSDESFENNPWKDLWVPHYDGKAYIFGEWDEFEYIDSI